jgi:hypothetical protein
LALKQLFETGPFCPNCPRSTCATHTCYWLKYHIIMELYIIAKALTRCGVCSVLGASMFVLKNTGKLKFYMTFAQLLAHLRLHSKSMCQQRYKIDAQSVNGYLFFSSKQCKRMRSIHCRWIFSDAVKHQDENTCNCALDSVLFQMHSFVHVFHYILQAYTWFQMSRPITLQIFFTNGMS